MKMDQIIGPSWLDEDCFVVAAKIPEGATKDQLPAMFQALLRIGFNSHFHKETHLRPGRSLSGTKNGAKPADRAEYQRRGQERRQGEFSFWRRGLRGPDNRAARSTSFGPVA